jgi:Polyketide cyclase / dehydrase and lipid transport
VSRSVERRRLERSAGEVAALVLDWSRDGEWRAAVTRMEVDPAGRARVGQRITERLRFGGRTHVTPTTIVEAGELSASFAGGTATVAVEGRRTVVPEDDGGCSVVLEVDVRMTGLLAVLNPVLAPAYRRRLAAEADALAALTAAEV